MRAGQVVALVVAAFVGSFAAGVDASECSYCQYAAWNCSLTATDASESLVQQAGKTDLRKESNAAVTDAVRVCDATGKIQVDDVFCDTNDCECADDKQCVSLVLGCQHIFQARSRKRCIGASAIQQRFNGCAAAQKLTTQAKANLDIDWVQFKNKQRCKSNDCKAVRRFHECGAVQCGYLIVAWKESASEYRFVVDGSRACDMEAGTFLFNASLKSLQSCNVKSIESTKINDCYSLQTRNQQNGTCNGIYLQVDSAYQTSFSQQIDFSKLSQGVWLTVVACIAAAVVSVASVLVIYIRFHRSAPQDELDGLLPDDLTDCKTPESQDSPELQDAATPATNDVRQRVISPKSQSGAGN